MAKMIYERRTNSSKKKVLIGFIFTFIFMLSSILLYLYPFASREKVNYFKGENPILFNGKQAGNGLVEGKSIYIPVSFLNKHIDDYIFWDESSNSVIITTKNKVIQMPIDSLTYFINQEPVQLEIQAMKAKNGDFYVALDPILSFYHIDYSILSDTNAIEIVQDGMTTQQGSIKGANEHEEKLRLRTEPSLRSAYTAQTVHNEKITIEKENEDFYYVRKENGTAGYLNKKYIKEGNTEKIEIKNVQNDVAVPQINGPIHLTWEAVYSKNPDTASIPVMPGVNVVSPTWFELKEPDGTVQNLGSSEYVNWAKNSGYQVWALFSNAFDPDLTHEAFKNLDSRQNIIRQLLIYSQMYQLDGINLDIENVREEDGLFVTQFVREATAYFHQAGLIVSMDITFITTGNWSAFYEREKLAETVDYLIVMAYDEHWGSSPKAGSVASFPWVENNLQKILEEVPNEKLILGVPLYTRLWEVKESGEISSKALKMTEVKEWLSQKGITPVYDDHSGQNYAEYYDPTTKITYQIWLEDELSLNKRAELSLKYQLKGVASWSRYFADDTAWLALSLDNKQVVQKE